MGKTAKPAYCFFKGVEAYILLLVGQKTKKISLYAPLNEGTQINFPGGICIFLLLRGRIFYELNNLTQHHCLEIANGSYIFT